MAGNGWLKQKNLQTGFLLLNIGGSYSYSWGVFFEIWRDNQVERKVVYLIFLQGFSTIQPVALGILNYQQYVSPIHWIISTGTIWREMSPFIILSVEWLCFFGVGKLHLIPPLC